MKKRLRMPHKNLGKTLGNAILFLLKYTNNCVKHYGCRLQIIGNIFNQGREP